MGPTRNEATMIQARYLTCAETAKLLRAALKRAFPGTKFSVRSNTYSMGASIYVRWTDGPALDAVQAVAKSYEGADFDGMIDLKSHATHWLLPDGSAIIARAEGTEGSGGVIPSKVNWRPHEDAEVVRFGADYVFCTRETREAVCS